jgi:hypothetical protein
MTRREQNPSGELPLTRGTLINRIRADAVTNPRHGSLSHQAEILGDDMSDFISNYTPAVNPVASGASTRGARHGLQGQVGLTTLTVRIHSPLRDSTSSRSQGWDALSIRPL